MKLGITDLQKQVIKNLEVRNRELTIELVEKIEENAKLLRIMDYLVDPVFRDYLKTVSNTDTIIQEFLESEHELKSLL